MIIARYILKNISQTFLGVVLVLMLVAQSGSLVTIFNEVTAGRMGADSVMVIMGLSTLNLLVLVLPLSIFLSVLITLSRFYQNSEMYAMMASGISPFYILKIIILFALIPAIVVGILSLQVIPWSNGLQMSILDKAVNSSKLEGMQEGRFREVALGGGVIYIEGMNPEHTRMQGVFLQQRLKNNSEMIIRATSGRYQLTSNGERFLLLEDGVRYQRTRGKLDGAVIHFQQHGVRLKKKKSATFSRKYTAVPTTVLLKDKSLLYKAELHSRLAPIFVTLLLAAMAVPLSQTSPRQGRYLRLGIGLVIYIVFTNLVSIGFSWISSGKIPAILGLWWAHGLMLLLLLFLLAQQTGFHYLLQKKDNS